MTRRTRLQPPATPQPWGKPKILALLVGSVVVFCTLVAGLGFSIRAAFTAGGGRHADAAAGSAIPTGDEMAARRDMLAAEPMLRVSQTDSVSGTPAARVAPAIDMPASTMIGPAKVAAGFPHTPEGAAAQLASIEVAVLTEMSIARTNEIHAAWSLPGAPAIEAWPLMGNVQSFLGAAGMGSAKDVGTMVTVTPVAAQIKATDGPDWTIACVLSDVRAVVRAEARVVYGYCERMAWDGQRWLVAPGAPPAAAPSTWPGTELAIKAGWRTWDRQGQ